MLLGLTVIFSAPERSPLWGCAFGSLVLTLLLSMGMERKKYFIKINIISLVSEVVNREIIYDKKENLVIVGKIQKSCLLLL